MYAQRRVNPFFNVCACALWFLLVRDCQWNTSLIVPGTLEMLRMAGLGNALQGTSIQHLYVCLALKAHVPLPLWRCGTTRKAVRVARTGGLRGAITELQALWLRASQTRSASRALCCAARKCCRTERPSVSWSLPPSRSSSGPKSPSRTPHVEISQSILAFADNFASS